MSVDAVSSALAAHGYLADGELATVVHLALTLQRPLLLEGAAGSGKTELAKVLAAWTGAPLIRLQCYEGLDAGQALYEWDYAKQLLHLRTAAGEGGVVDDVYAERFLVRRPLLRAVTPAPGPPPVLLVDELDRADDELEALLLEVLADAAVTIPEIGTVRAERPPVVVITSNRTRDLHDALKRRCLYHWLDHPSFDREVAILRLRLPGLEERLAAEVAALTAELRTLGLYKPPGVAEAIDWAAALRALGLDALDDRAVDRTLGVVVKHREDGERVRAEGVASMVRAAQERTGLVQG